jgi:sialate O-acetylesterase
MIKPLVPFGIRGVIWYQGERNAKTIAGAQLYADQLELLVADWRNQWSQDDLPFGVVQLPNFHASTDKAVQNTPWVMLRESQMKILNQKNTGVAITTDVGMAKDIHPKNKQAVGHRLALWALGTTYEKDLLYSGPIVASVEFKAGAGTITMDHVGQGLKTSDGGEVFKGFAIAGEDQVFYPAVASCQSVAGRMILSSPKVPNPIAVRYNWADNPNGNLVNSAELPAAPFRTDSWEIVADK